MDFVKYIFSAIAAVFGYATERSKENNSPEMKTADSAQKDADLKNKVDGNISSQNDDDIRDQISP